MSVLHHNRPIPAQVLERTSGVYDVRFTPDGPGQYKIHVSFNDMEIKGSFTFYELFTIVKDHHLYWTLLMLVRLVSMVIIYERLVLANWQRL